MFLDRLPAVGGSVRVSVDVMLFSVVGGGLEVVNEGGRGPPRVV